ncbi:MAG: serine hydrolase [Kiritimatiellae bacterium]|nr:serine hydrolase [Kiritimatiellia bacterium]
MKQPFDPTPILKQSLDNLGCRGILLGVSENGKITTYSVGSIPDEDHDRPYYIYSISKSFTATAIMKLCEEEGDFLDEPFSSFFPDTKIPHSITVRQMLNHTGGISDYFSSPEYRKALKDRPTEPWSYEMLMNFGLRNTPLFEAGKGWSYSNPGYALLDELIEKKSGMDSYDYVKKVIIDKIDLKNTRPFLKADLNLELLEGDDDSFEGDFRILYHPGWIAPACYISTVSEVARFYDALFGGQLLRKESVAEMIKTVDVFPNPPKESIPSYGLGLMHGRNSPLGDGYGHGGGGPGYTTFAIHYPNLEGSSVSVSLVLNKSLPQTPFDLADEIVKHYIETQIK